MRVSEISNNYKDLNSVYYKSWQTAEKKNKLPNRLRNIISYDYLEFKELIYSDNKNFSEKIVDSLISGDIFLLKKCFSKDFIYKLKVDITKYFNNNKDTFYKLKEGIPNFVREFNENSTKKYAMYSIKKSAFFFPWNKSSISLFPTINDKWRLIKYLSGFKKNCWEKNTPKDGIIDRIQIVNYPPNKGTVELHQDPYLYQKFFISGYMSEKGDDFNKGGAYCINKSDQKIYIEDKINIGDISFGWASIFHGVDKPENCKKTKNYLPGRWFCGLYSNVSDHVVDRVTSKPAKL